MISVFWPIDVKASGFCYGWKEPSLCVAGVLEADTGTEAEAVLLRMCSSLTWDPRHGAPVILGFCTYTEDFYGIDLSSWMNSEYYLIYYIRNSPTSLRFYSFHELSPGASPAESTEPTENPSQPTSCAFRGKMGIGDVTISQLNSSKIIDTSAYLRRPFSLPSILGQPLQATYTKLGDVIANVSYAIGVICSIPAAFPPSSLQLKDVSNIIQQLDVRAEQIHFLVTDVTKLKQRNSTPIFTFAALYTNFFNILWLILNDMTIGFAFGSFISENRTVLASLLNTWVTRYLIDWPVYVLFWLDSWPAGLKLNTELSRFYSQSFVALITLWGDALHVASSYLPMVLLLIGVFSQGGVTTTFSFFSDLLSLCTLHIYVSYTICDWIYAKFLTTGGSLWNLFRGKRYNILRNRTDSWEYDMDQLFFGTILFTLLAFLFPTVLAYYSLFALMRLGVILLHFVVETILAFMNHFPLFALMLRVKDPWRLPGGIYFQLSKSRSSGPPRLVLRNQPVSFASIFFQYLRLWSHLSAHYNPTRLLRCLVIGKFLAPIPRYSIRYNKLSPREI